MFPCVPHPPPPSPPAPNPKPQSTPPPTCLQSQPPKHSCRPNILFMFVGKLEAASRIPADLQLQLQQAQQQNQTLARILAERCEQAAAHVENQHQLQDVWQQLMHMQAVPAGSTVQVGNLHDLFVHLLHTLSSPRVRYIQS